MSKRKEKTINHVYIPRKKVLQMIKNTGRFPVEYEARSIIEINFPINNLLLSGKFKKFLFISPPQSVKSRVKITSECGLIVFGENFLSHEKIPLPRFEEYIEIDSGHISRIHFAAGYYKHVILRGNIKWISISEQAHIENLYVQCEMPEYFDVDPKTVTNAEVNHPLLAKMFLYAINGVKISLANLKKE